MSFTAQLQFDSLSGGGTGTANLARALAYSYLGGTVRAKNGGTNGSATTWTFEFISVPVGSAIALGVAQTGATNNYVFDPDVVGSYLVKMTLTDGTTTLSTYRVVTIALPSGKLLPPFMPQGYDPVLALNFGGGTFGWEAMVRTFLLNGEIDASEVWAEHLDWQSLDDRTPPNPRVFTRRWADTAADGSAFELGGTETIPGPPLRVSLPIDTAAIVKISVTFYDGTNTEVVEETSVWTRVASAAPALQGTKVGPAKQPGVQAWTATAIAVGNTVSVQCTAAASVQCKAVITVMM